MHEQYAIESMPLYVNVDRINNELTARGIGVDEALTPAQLFPFDQYHYTWHGRGAGCAPPRPGPYESCPRIGAGLGGPARYLASTMGCHVTALELEGICTRWRPDSRPAAASGSASPTCGGCLLPAAFPEATFDAVVGWLTLLHIPERPRLLARLARMLRRGGQCYIEDLYQGAPFATSDLYDVHQTIFGVTLTSIADYVRDLHEAGFTGIMATAPERRLGGLLWRTRGGLAGRPSPARAGAWRADLHPARHVLRRGAPAL